MWWVIIKGMLIGCGISGAVLILVALLLESWYHRAGCHFRVWYPDGERLVLMTLESARTYRETFGGTIVDDDTGEAITEKPSKKC